MADLIHPARENQRVPASRHDELMAALHKLEMELDHALREIDDLKEEAITFCDWMRRDSEKSQWYYDNRDELRGLVESSKWVKTLRRAVAWLIGAVAGTIMVAQQIEVWVREHLQ